MALAPHSVFAKESRADLVKELRAEYAARAWSQAVVTARRLVALDPKEPLGWYDLACMQSRAGTSEEAVRSLGESAARGFDLVATLLRDEDLDAIRDQPGFDDVLRSIRANNARSLERFKTRAQRDARIRVIRGGVDPKRPAALVVALHGRGGNAVSFGAALAPVAAALGALLVVPEGMEKLRDGGFGWGKVEEGEYLALLAIKRARKDQLIDPARIVLVGFSQGGATAIAVALRHPEAMSGVVVLAAGDDPRVYAVPDLPRESIPRFALLVGGEDPEAKETRLLAERFEKEGVRVALRVEPGLGHDLPRDAVRVLADAIRFARGERERLSE